MATAHQGYLDGNHGREAVSDDVPYWKGYMVGVEDRERSIHYTDYSKGKAHKPGDWVWMYQGTLVEVNIGRHRKCHWRSHNRRVKIYAVIPEIPGYIDEHGAFIRPRVAQICWIGHNRCPVYAAFSEIYAPPEVRDRA